MRRRSRRGLLGSLAALSWVVLLLTPVGAAADVFGPISLVSEGATPGAREPQQAEFAHDTAISANGQYVAFDGSVGGVTGVWRRDLATGEMQQVAGGDAELPSISESGQYVSFTTNEGDALPAITDDLPDETPQQEAVNVYVRDMSRTPGETEAFTVASAVNGGSEPLSYETREPDSFGSTAAGRSAISADGQEVVFVTTAESNLDGPHTPAMQVAVRYRSSKETRLVSVQRGSGAPVGSEDGAGAVFVGGQVGSAPAFTGPGLYGELTHPPAGASISADGSTVAWMGTNISEQAPALSGEALGSHYSEPLWRRIEPGAETPTERVTGGSEPGEPACAQSGETSLPQTPSSSDPCQGPFATRVPGNTGVSGIWTSTGGAEDFVPRLSADGNTVAFMSEAPLVSLGSNFGNGAGDQASDLYVADMEGGLSRKQALTPLTELAGSSTSGLADTAPIFDFGISPDGRQLAFSTRRTQFPLGSPSFVSPPAAEAGLNELFDADLGDGTLTRVTHGFAGGPGEHPHGQTAAGRDPYEADAGDGALSPSFSANGRLLAFASTASNLVFGDGNTPLLFPSETSDGSDAFVVERQVFESITTSTYVSEPPPRPRLAPPWALGVTAFSRGDGSVVVYVQTPGSGALRASAESAVVVKVAHAAHGARGRRDARGATVPAIGHRGGSRQTIAMRAVSSTSAHASAGGGELVALVLKLGKLYSPLAARRGGLSATVTVTFSAPGARTLRQSIQTTFLHKAPAKHSARHGHAAVRRAGRR